MGNALAAYGAVRSRMCDLISASLGPGNARESLHQIRDVLIVPDIEGRYIDPPGFVASREIRDLSATAG